MYSIKARTNKKSPFKSLEYQQKTSYKTWFATINNIHGKSIENMLNVQWRFTFSLNLSKCWKKIQPRLPLFFHCPRDSNVCSVFSSRSLQLISGMHDHLGPIIAVIFLINNELVTSNWLSISIGRYVCINLITFISDTTHPNESLHQMYTDKNQNRWALKKISDEKKRM